MTDLENLLGDSLCWVERDFELIYDALPNGDVAALAALDRCKVRVKKIEAFLNKYREERND